MSKLEEDIRKAELSARPGKFLCVLVLSGILAGVLGGVVYWLVSDLPSVNAIEGYVPVESSKVYSGVSSKWEREWSQAFIQLYIIGSRRLVESEAAKSPLTRSSVPGSTSGISGSFAFGTV